MAKLDYLTYDDGFLEPDRLLPAKPDEAKAVVVPCGLEASVSYGGGTAQGPAAILAASHQLELFDEELWCEPYASYGIATLKPLPQEPSVEPALDTLAETVDAILEQDRFPLVLGGEHSLTPGALRPFAKRYDDLVVLQIDAHADLRDGYLGEHYSHASAMRRALDFDNITIVSLGIRALSQQEADFYEANRRRIEIWWAKDQAHWNLDDLAEKLRGKNIYVTFDIDGLDAAQMPATGTPTPGGLDYWLALGIVRCAAKAGTIVGADVVELAPIEGFHAFDYTAAAVAYKIMNYALYGAEPAAAPAASHS
ncbi:MAG: agmatinase [Pseudomonadota bacterium]